MSTHLSYTVDTSPMAKEMKSISNHVAGTTAAVVTMQTAVIAAEKAGTEHIVSNVNRGFYALMRSQISQKIASSQSRVEALLINLSYQKRRLLAIKSAMERDYGRIAARYLRLFGNINKELEKRIRQIDQPIFELVTRHMTTSYNRMYTLAGQVNIMQDESLTASQQILMSSVKRDAQGALNQTSEFLTHQGKQRQLTSQITISQPGSDHTEIKYMPVVVIEKDENGYLQMDYTMPHELLNSDQQNVVRATFHLQGNLSWHEQEPPKVIADEFLRLINQSSLSQRVRELAIDMYNKAHLQTL